MIFWERFYTKTGVLGGLGEKLGMGNWGGYEKNWGGVPKFGGVLQFSGEVLHKKWGMGTSQKLGY